VPGLLFFCAASLDLRAGVWPAAQPTRPLFPFSCIYPPAPGIWYPASGIRHRVSGIRHPVSGIRHLASGIRHLPHFSLLTSRSSLLLGTGAAAPVPSKRPRGSAALPKAPPNRLRTATVSGSTESRPTGDGSGRDAAGPTGLCRVAPRPWRRLDSGSARAPACHRRRLAVGTGTPCIPTGLGGAPPQVGRRCAGAASWPRRCAALPRPTASGIRYPASGIRYPASGIRYPASGIRYPASGIRYPASGIRYPASGIRYPASGLWHPSSPSLAPPKKFIDGRDTAVYPLHQHPARLDAGAKAQSRD
jgi:hypothetical protein